MMVANQLSQKYERLFIAQISSYETFGLCASDTDAQHAPEKLSDLCLYGFVVAQWVGVVGSDGDCNTNSQQV